MSGSTGLEFKPSEVVWISGSLPIVVLGLKRALENTMMVHTGHDLPNRTPACIVYCSNDTKDLSQGVKHLQELNSEAPILVFGIQIDLELAKAAFKMGARGFIHAGMMPDQIARAITVASRGEIVAPRQLLENLLVEGDPVHFNILTSRQREILELLADGLSNAQIAQRLYLSESTVKQHLRAAYKTLGVNNRTEAANLFRNSD